MQFVRKKNITREKATIQRNENTSHLWRHLEEFHSNDDVSLAYHVVEDEGFKAQIKIAFLKYKLPGRDFIKSFVSKLFDKFVNLKDFININFK
jgi:hypothetical protein